MPKSTAPKISSAPAQAMPARDPMWILAMVRLCDKARRLTGSIPVVCPLGSSFQLVNHRFDRRQFLGIGHSAYNTAQMRRFGTQLR
jgi:hypothetical protein